MPTTATEVLDPKRRKNPSPVFRCNIAVQKVLASAGMRPGKIEMFLGHPGVWEAATDKGPRWVTHTPEGRWRISKSAPAPAGARP